MKLWAHRGSHDGVAPLENTLPAFERALAEGADGVELDVHVSADGVPLVFHDETTTRLAEGGVALTLAETPAAALRAVRLTDGGHMPTLAEVLDLLAGRLPINVEIKDATALPAVLACLRAARPAQIVLSSFDAAAMVSAWQVAPQWPRAVIHGPEAAARDLLGELEAAHADAWHTSADLATAARIAAFGRPCRVWTVNTVAQARALATRGAAGIFTDQPGAMRAALGRKTVA